MGGVIRILLIDGNRGDTHIRSLLATGSSRFAVEQVACCAAASKRIEMNGIDAILLNLDLFNSEQLRLCQQMGAQAHHLPIVVLASVDDENLAVEAVRLGVEDYLVKDRLDARTLQRTIRVAIERHLARGCDPGTSTTDLSRPRWDPGRRALWIGQALVKRFVQASPNQEAILVAFEEHAWVKRILDPLPPHPEIDSKYRLRATTRSLNKCQLYPLIRFFGDGTGKAVCWQFLSRPPCVSH